MMMLMRVANLLLIAALAAVGITMSAHSLAEGDHSTTTLSAATVTAQAVGQPHPQQPSDSAPPASDSGGSAGADGAEDHSGLLMACAFLALLLIATFLLPVLALRLGFTPPTVVSAEKPTRGTVTARPPDLAELCISRQ